MSSEPQATQVNLFRHQHTELPTSKFQRNKESHLGQDKPTTNTSKEINKVKDCHKSIEVLIKKMDVASVVTPYI